ncbi:MAG: hypothetical protein WCP36_10815 [Methanomicrobiales archaeon]
MNKMMSPFIFIEPGKHEYTVQENPEGGKLKKNTSAIRRCAKMEEK